MLPSRAGFVSVHSPEFMADTAQKLATAIPHATLRALDGQTHDVKPSAVAPEIADFLKNQV